MRPHGRSAKRKPERKIIKDFRCKDCEEKVREGKKGPKGPNKYTQEYIEELADKLSEYINSTAIPFIKEFAYKNSVPSTEISKVCVKNHKFEKTLKELKDRQEVGLVKLALSNKANCSMAIFALKNVSGWRDAKDLHHTGEMKTSQVNIIMPTDKKLNGHTSDTQAERCLPALNE